MNGNNQQYSGAYFHGGVQGQSQGQWPGQGQGQGQPMGPGPQMAPMGVYPSHAYPGYYPQQPNRSLFGMPNDRFLKGIMIGAAVTYLATNEQVQRTAIKGVVKAWSLMQGGIEEVKERFGDAAAELHHSDQT